MPSIRDKSTVRALALEFTSNGRKQEEAMVSVGYSLNYARSYCGKMWDNPIVKAAIQVIDSKNEVKTIASRRKRQEFWTETMESADKTVNRRNRLRASELLGKSECDFIEKTINLYADIPSDPIQYKSWLQQELAKIEDTKEVIESYEKSTDALAKRH